MSSTWLFKYLDLAAEMRLSKSAGFLNCTFPFSMPKILPVSWEEASRVRAKFISFRETARAMDVKICASEKLEVFSETKILFLAFLAASLIISL